MEKKKRGEKMRGGSIEIGSREVDLRFLDERSLDLEARIGLMLSKMAEGLGYKFEYGLVTGEELVFVFFAAKEGKRKRIGALRFKSDPSVGGQYELAAVTRPEQVDATRWVIIQPTCKPGGGFRYETSGGIIEVFKAVLDDSDLVATKKSPVWFVLGKMLGVVEPDVFKKLVTGE